MKTESRIEAVKAARRTELAVSSRDVFIVAKGTVRDAEVCMTQEVARGAVSAVAEAQASQTLNVAAIANSSGFVLEESGQAG